VIYRSWPRPKGEPPFANSLNLGRQPRKFSERSIPVKRRQGRTRTRHRRSCDTPSRSSMADEKSVSATGGWLRRAGGFAGRTAPANVLLKRRYGASDNQTNIQVSVFPNSRFLFSRTCCDRSFFMRDDCSINEMHLTHLNQARCSSSR
jgi:hypothetical protein